MGGKRKTAAEKLSKKAPSSAPTSATDPTPSAGSTSPSSATSAQTPPTPPTTETAVAKADIGYDPELLAPALISQPKESKARKLLELIYSKEGEGKPLAYLCDLAEFPYEDLVDVVEKHFVNVARLGAAPEFPGVLKDTAIDARSRIVMCESCFGTKKLHISSLNGPVEIPNKPCPKCAGLGTTRKVGDKNARMLIFETLGLIGKGHGPLIAQQFIMNPGADQVRHVSLGQKLLEAGRKMRTEQPSQSPQTNVIEAEEA